MIIAFISGVVLGGLLLLLKAPRRLSRFHAAWHAGGGKISDLVKTIRVQVALDPVEASFAEGERVLREASQAPVPIIPTARTLPPSA